jgi:hypothetical protein
MDLALEWIGERLNGEDGLGGIFPAMANAVMAYHSLGYPPDHGERAVAQVVGLLHLGDLRHQGGEAEPLDGERRVGGEPGLPIPCGDLLAHMARPLCGAPNVKKVRVSVGAGDAPGQRVSR